MLVILQYLLMIFMKKSWIENQLLKLKLCHRFSLLLPMLPAPGKIIMVLIILAPLIITQPPLTMVRFLHGKARSNLLIARIPRVTKAHVNGSTQRVTLFISVLCFNSDIPLSNHLLDLHLPIFLLKHMLSLPIPQTTRSHGCWTLEQLIMSHMIFQTWHCINHMMELRI